MHVVRQFTEEQFNEAVENLQRYFVVAADWCARQGYAYQMSDLPQDTLEHKSDKILLLSTVGNDTAIYKPAHNMLLRFWHDVKHIQLKRGFAKQDEYTVILAQYYYLRYVLSASNLELEIFWCDMYGQAVYYDQRKQYVNNQTSFIHSAVRHGIKNACMVVH
tara:strand:- start:15093 stop:15578 length:486 start_codon:yes stop_codon:yes gene_type:complete